MKTLALLAACGNAGGHGSYDASNGADIKSALVQAQSSQRHTVP